MFRGLRLRLSLLYALAALALVALIGGGAYLNVANYFANVTDRALEWRMVQQFRSLNLPIPESLEPIAASYTDTSLEGAAKPSDDDKDDDDHHEEEDHHTERDTPPTTVDSAELAAVVVVGLRRDGQALTLPDAAPTQRWTNQQAFQAAMATGSDRRTVTAPDGHSVRLLTYRIPDVDDENRRGLAAFQLARDLGSQERVLRELTGGLLLLGTLSMVLVGMASWWLAGRAMQPMQAAWERQQRFVASASHELRTPLTLIRASTEVALRNPGTDQDTRNLLSDVVAETDHMRHLVDDMLTLSRLDSHRLTLDTKPIALALLLHDVQRQVARLADERGILVTIKSSAGNVIADGERLRQIILILLDNALRHTPAGGTITMTTSTQGTQTIIAVSDTGSGIAPEHLPHIFEHFYRADPARGRETGNAGLGLAIAHGLVEAMHGQMSANSTLGQGTIMRIILPGAPDVPHLPSAPQSPGAGAVDPSLDH